MALSLTTNYLASSALLEFSKKIIPPLFPLSQELYKGQSGKHLIYVYFYIEIIVN